ncbi:MAG: glycoside hydrolase family 5 protein [Defluviitaleaceae bacterium]|nr:glycoside hydrolase family 5 protein [Defluviitaleaceae bacterium]
MKKFCILIALASVMALAACSGGNGEPAEPEAPTFTPVTGWDMMSRLGMGINIGNTMDARVHAENPWFTGCPVTEMETIWGAAQVEPWQFEAIAQRGFSTVRIPVSWEPRFIDDEFTISPAWMDRVQNAVDWAISAGLYVILNTHHEEYLYRFMHEGPHEEAERWLYAVWTQVSERFKYYPEQLMFEPMNEPRPGHDGWFWCPDRFADEIPVLAATANELSTFVLDVIRTSGGHNDQRIVHLTTVQADSNLIYLYEHPDDPYVMFGSFFYLGREDNQLAQISAGLERGIPIVIKETSPLEMPAEEMSIWSERYYAELAELGVPSVWWNTSGHANDDLFNRTTGEWNEAMVEIFFAAYGAPLGPAMPRPLFPHELTRAANIGGLVQWIVPPGILDAAEFAIVEIDIEEMAGDFLFSANLENEGWTQFRSYHERITREPGRLVFDLSGLELVELGFMFLDSEDFEGIRRAYLM